MNNLHQLPRPALRTFSDSNANSVPEWALLTANTVRDWALTTAGASMLLACCLTSFLIVEHLTSYNKPEEQKWIVSCVFMVPLYAVCSFMSLWRPQLETVTNLIRNSYEAWSLYSFGMYLIACLGGEERTIEKLSGRPITPSDGPKTHLLAEAKHPPGYSRIREPILHVWPMNYVLPPWVPGPEFYAITKVGVVQYMVLKSSCGIIQLCLDPWRLYGEGDFDWGTGSVSSTPVPRFFVRRT